MLKPDVSLDRKAAHPSAHNPIFPPEVQKLALTGVPLQQKIARPQLAHTNGNHSSCSGTTWGTLSIMEIWALALVLLIAALGVLGMLGYTKTETEKLELKHLLATEQFRREISDLEDKHASQEAQRQETIQELTRQVEALEEENGKLQASLDKLRKQQASREAASALDSMPSAAAV